MFLVFCSIQNNIACFKWVTIAHLWIDSAVNCTAVDCAVNCTAIVTRDIRIFFLTFLCLAQAIRGFFFVENNFHCNTKVICFCCKHQVRYALSCIALCTLLCHQMVFSSAECIVWRKMLGYVWDTSRSMFMLFLTRKNACDLDSLG